MRFQRVRDKGVVCFLGGVCLWTAAVPVCANELVPVEARIAVYNIRPWVCAGLLAFTFACLLWGGRRLASWLARPGRVLFVGCGLLFPAWYTLVWGIHGHAPAPVVALYWLWGGVAFVAAPALLQTQQHVRWTVQVLAAAALLVLVAAGIGAAAFDLNTVVPGGLDPGLLGLLGERAPFGFTNSNYYGQLLQLLCVALLFSAVTRPGSAWPYVLLIVALAVLVTLARARNVLVFLLAAVPVTLIGARSPRLLVRSGLVAAAVLVVVVSVVREMEYDELNRIATGRLDFWDFVIEQVVETDTPVWSLVAGPGELRGYRGIKTYDTAGSGKQFNKLHTDNVYLELLVEAGLIGLLLFLLPYLFVGLRLFQLTTRGDPAAAWALGCALGIALQSMLVGVYPTFNSPVGVMVVLLGVPVAFQNDNLRPNDTSQLAPYRSIG